MKLTLRQRATLSAVVGLGAAPLIAVHGRLIFRPYIIEGGHANVFASMALFALYYMMVRTTLDLCRDCLDYFQGQYRTEGDQYQIINQRRKNQPPYDQLTAPGIRREFSNWQYLMLGWMFMEILIAWIGFAGMLYAFFRSPYPAGPAHPFYLSEHAGSTRGVVWFVEVMSFPLVYFALYSIGYRWDIGLASLIQRGLGMRDTYPGQNKFPGVVNELAIKCIGRPM